MFEFHSNVSTVLIGMLLKMIYESSHIDGEEIIRGIDTQEGTLNKLNLNILNLYTFISK